MARIGCILLCAIASAIIAFLLVAQAGAKRTALAKSTVRIQVAQGHGSGVHIGNGYILTAAHVVGLEKSVQIKNSLGSNGWADVLWTNEAHDVALLRFHSNALAPGDSGLWAVSRLNCSDKPAIGQHIEAIGNPGSLNFVHSWGRVAGPIQTLFNWQVAFIADLGIAPGSSGGPVIDEQGRVVGIVVGISLTHFGWTPSATNFSVIVPSNGGICQLLARQG